MSTSPSSSGGAAAVLHDGCAARFGRSSGDPLVSVIVPVYGNWDITEQCLISVVRCDPEIALELIVVDDCSSDRTPEALARLPGVNVVRNARNIGFVHGCNRGASMARGKYLFFLNNDTLLRGDSIAPLVRRMEHDETIGIAGSKLLYPDGTLQEAGGIVWADGFVWNYGRLDDVDRPEYNFARDVDYVSGAALLVRADLFRELGSFDVRYAPAYYEDADLCFAARARGMRVVYEPASVVTHYEGYTAGRDVNTGIKRFYEINRPKFESKWYAMLRGEHVHYSDSNVRRAARGRGQTKPAVLVIAPSSPRNSTPRGRRLRSLVSGFAEAGHRVVFLPHDLAEAQPWTGEMQHAGVEVLYDIPGDARGWSEHLADVLPTVDAVVIRGAELVRRYLPAIRARCGVPIVYDAERLGESDDGARAASVAAADGTLVETEREAELIRAERLGPVAVMAAAHDSEPPSFTDAHALLAGLLSPTVPVVPETRVAAALVQEYQSGEQPPNAYDGTAAGNDLEPARTAALFARFFEERARADQIARERDRFSETLTATSGELDQERAAHRKTFRREAEARLARQHADGLIQQQAAELERLVRCREADDEERKLLLLQLARAQSLAAARTAEARDGSSEAGALIVPPEQDAALAAS